MLSCKQVTDLSSDQLDGRYRGWKRVQISVHRLICRHCRRFERHLRRSRDTSAAIGRRLWGQDDSAVNRVMDNLNSAPDGD